MWAERMFVAVAVWTLALAGQAVAADPKLLPPEEAFRFSARALDDKTLEARFAVTDGYYLYRDKMRFALDPADLGPASAVLHDRK